MDLYLMPLHYLSAVFTVSWCQWICFLQFFTSAVTKLLCNNIGTLYNCIPFLRVATQKVNCKRSLKFVYNNYFLHVLLGGARRETCNLSRYGQSSGRKKVYNSYKAWMRRVPIKLTLLLWYYSLKTFKIFKLLWFKQLICTKWISRT